MINCCRSFMIILELSWELLLLEMPELIAVCLKLGAGLALLRYNTSHRFELKSWVTTLFCNGGVPNLVQLNGLQSNATCHRLESIKKRHLFSNSVLLQWGVLGGGLYRKSIPMGSLPVESFDKGGQFIPILPTCCSTQYEVVLSWIYLSTFVWKQCRGWWLKAS